MKQEMGQHIKSSILIASLLLSVLLIQSTSLSGDPQKTSITKSEITPSEVEKLKQKVGVYMEDKNYNQLINGHGTGLRPPTNEQWNQLPEKTQIVRKIVSTQSVPSSLDLSTTQWFPPIGNQGTEGSCVAWAVGYYTKTFQEAKEHNWDLSGALWEGGYSGHPSAEYQNHIISPDFIYHLINFGTDGGSYFDQAINLVCFIGASSWEKMPYNMNDHTSWPSEEAWREASFYRGASSGYEYMFVETDADVQSLKAWLAAENLAVIAVDANQYSHLTYNDVWTLDNYWFPNVNHANTIVGYDDNLAYYENGQIRYGAFKVANSWGVGSWENVPDGFYWISYATMKLWIGFCMFYHDRIGYEPEILASFRINHEKRAECQITVGVGNESSPLQTKNFDDYISGGSHPFPSNNIVFDVTEFMDSVPSALSQSFFLKVYDGESSTTGTVVSFAVNSQQAFDAPTNTVNGRAVYVHVAMAYTLSIASIGNAVIEAAENTVYFIIPDPSRMARTVAAYDSVASSIIYGMSRNNQIQSFDSNALYVSQGADRGKLLLSNKTVILFGGWCPNWCVNYLQKNNATPIAFVAQTEDGQQHFKFLDTNTSVAKVDILRSSVDFEHEDYFVIMTLKDENDNRVFIFYGFDWKGTWCAGIYFKTMYQSISSYINPYYIFHWVDANGDGIPQTNEVTQV
jgi:hypothetical protein